MRTKRAAVTRALAYGSTECRPDQAGAVSSSLKDIVNRQAHPYAGGLTAVNRLATCHFLQAT